MEANGSSKWRFQANQDLIEASSRSVRKIVVTLMESLGKEDTRPAIPLGHGDPSVFPYFRTTVVAEDAVVDAIRSGNYNSYCTDLQGVLPARRAVAEDLSQDLPYKLSPEDVFLTSGCKQAIEHITAVLACPNANILLPRPGFPDYEAHAMFYHLEFRLFDLLPDKGWEVDLEAVEALADDNTVAMVIINPGNPCGNVYTYQHLMKVAETARKLGIMVISDEAYARLNFGANPFVPMGTFASVAPVITLGSISKRWLVPGWRLGWLVKNDPHGILAKSGVVESLKSYRVMTSDAATFLQGAFPEMIEKTKEEFFCKILKNLRVNVDICYDKIKGIPYLICPYKPEGSMFMLVKLNLALLDGIRDDMDFCEKLAREESVIVLPGVAVGLKNWLRITFAIEPSALEEGLERIIVFCHRHSKR
ncbi:S-alkyl-thiohydroximate lyase SUR1-like [Prosopis cineraria]|uniref:S-alkyl-thiohydroximate lyase SUR1-like n=1 Tax=Prosopis cineraria TaxID=364024 RepID=UPI0024102D6A|nr:S-alkyl-thiohydroximate lyase SUR1-like [Prosopis cineraria]